jgi:Arc/MetJ family transcription regulator
MRTTIDLPEGLIEEARRASQMKTMRETVIAGLQELVRKGHREELRRMAGGLAMDIDLPRSRKRKHR